MLRLVTTITLSLCLVATAQAAPLDCHAFLTGRWTGKGEMNIFGTTTSLDNTYTYNVDGTFKTVNRFKSSEEAWQEQSLLGTWSTTPGEGAGTCRLTLTSTFDSGGATGSSSSSTEVTHIDEDTFRSMDFDMHRAVPD